MAYCKNCNTTFDGNFCNHCGQKKFTENDKSLRHILSEMMQFFTNFDGQFFTTLKTIYSRPGKLSLDYCNGIRKRYYKPISLYLLLIVLYLLFPLAKGLNVSVEQHKIHFLYKDYAVKTIHSYQKENNLNDTEFTLLFQQTSTKVSKVLLLLFIPFTVFNLFLFFPRKKTLLYDRTILATEINIVHLSITFLLYPAVLLLFYQITGIVLIRSEFIFTLIPSIIFILYCFLIFRKVYAEHWGILILKTIPFAFLHFLFMATLYRFLTFQATMFLL